MRQVELHHGAATDTGLVREHNEDSFLVEPPLYVVADGMGGHDGGEVASRIVVEEFGRLAHAGYDVTAGPQAVRDALDRCHQQISDYDAEQRRGGALQFHSATTAVVAMVVEDDGLPAWLVANVGDSRAYRFSDDVLAQVSVDHSRVQELWEAGRITGRGDRHPPRAPRRHPRRRRAAPPRPRLLRAPAAAGRAAAAVQRRHLRHDRARPRGRHPAPTFSDPRDAADRLVRAAVHAGGRDNATAVVVDVVGLASESAYDSARQRVSLEQKLGALP